MAPSVIQKAFVPGPSLFRCSFVILQGLTSLREICHGLSCCNGKLVHLGILKPPNKSTLPYANEHRSSELFRDLFWSLLGRFRATGKLGINGKRTFRFKNKLLSFRLDGDQPLPFALSLGELPLRQGRDQGACPFRPRRLHALFR